MPHFALGHLRNITVLRQQKGGLRPLSDTDPRLDQSTLALLRRMAFVNGLAWNLVNVGIVGFLLVRVRQSLLTGR